MNQIEPEGKEKQLLDEDEVEDEAEKDETVRPVQYEITSFGADYDAEGLVKRLQRGDIYIPPFQRSFVWTQKEASRFIESLLLGLPVPGIFLARDIDSKNSWSSMDNSGFAVSSSLWKDILILHQKQVLKTYLCFKMYRSNLKELLTTH